MTWYLVLEIGGKGEVVGDVEKLVGYDFVRVPQARSIFFLTFRLFDFLELILGFGGSFGNASGEFSW